MPILNNIEFQIAKYIKEPFLNNHKIFEKH